MTALFDEKARENFTSDIYLMPEAMSNIRIKDIKVEPMDKKVAREYISMFHYSRTFPDSTIYCYGAYYNDFILGVICYGMGCGKNQYTAIIPDIKNGEYIELTRLWCSDNSPKNIESYLISRSLKLLPREIKLVISFSDESEGHCGIIYQASNFYYLGINDGGKMLEMSDGVKKHPRLLGIYRMRHPEYKDLTNDELLDILGFRYVGG